MKTFVASKNLGKLVEMRAIFAGSVLELDTYPLYSDPAEGDTTYADNARLKAHALHAQLRAAGIRAAVLSDDSGLEVAALGGRPGVLSARYAGLDATWPHRRDCLLAELTGTPDEARDAKFVCAMTLVLEDGTLVEGYGESHGYIAREVRGKHGFGYDPLFIDPERRVTYAELSDDEKNAISHRRRAADALLAALAARV